MLLVTSGSLEAQFYCTGPEGVYKKRCQLSLLLMSVEDMWFQERGRTEELHNWDINWERCWRRDISLIHICHRLLSFWIPPPPQQRSQSSIKCLFLEEPLKNLRFIKLVALLITLVKKVTGMYMSLAALEFLQRKSVYGLFHNSESHPPRRLCKRMVACQEEKKNIGNCTSLIKPSGLSNIKGNLMDPAICIIWGFYLAEKNHLEIGCCHGQDMVNNGLQWLWITGVYLRNSKPSFTLLSEGNPPLPPALQSQGLTIHLSREVAAGPGRSSRKSGWFMLCCCSSLTASGIMGHKLSGILHLPPLPGYSFR